jgi:methionine-rich copper-binding protein CopC
MMSRKDFLKLLGAGGTIVALGGLGGFRSLLNDKKTPSSLSSPSPSLFPQLASAQTAPGGTWSLGKNTSILAIHAALTPAGRIFYVAGSGFCVKGAAGPYQARLLDLATGAETTIGGQSNDLFCMGSTILANGNIFMCGGTKQYDTDVNNCNGKWHGGNFAYEFNVSSSSLSKQGIQQMAQGRWYPTCVTLPDGKVLIVGGQDDYGDHNYITEIYNPATKSITINYDPTSNNTYCVGSAEKAKCPGAGSPCYGGPNRGVAPWLSLYPRMHLMPSGLVFDAGPTQATYLWDPSNGSWRRVNNTLQYRDYGTSFLLPLQNTTAERGKVMIVGGSTNDTTAATNVVEIEDFNQGTSTSPVLRRGPSIHHARKYLNPIILPNGKLVIFAGSSQNVTNPVLIPEMFDPENENAGWTDLPAATVPRVYHGIALLLPDGSVWTACSTRYSCTTEYRTEIFKPAYFSSTRPTISAAPTVGAYGQSITIPTPNAASITRVSLVRLAASTHHYDANVRLVWLQITARTGSSITVSAPINANIAPPGYYMIHVLTGSATTGFVPSVARIIQIPGTGTGGGGGGTTTPPAQVTGLTATAISSTQINLSWTAVTAATSYNVYRSTTAGFTVNTATDTPIARPTTNSYSNTGLTASTTYYYRVAAVNSSGTGTPSAIASATTPAGTGTDTTPPKVSSTTPANGATGVAVNSNITIVFSEQMQASTVTWQNIAFTNAAGASIDRQVTLATDNRTCTVIPVGNNLARNTRFTITVLTGVKDLAGNSMASPYSFSFTTTA